VCVKDDGSISDMVACTIFTALRQGGIRPKSREQILFYQHLLQLFKYVQEISDKQTVR